jgi:hypothetical protein
MRAKQKTKLCSDRRDLLSFPIASNALIEKNHPGYLKENNNLFGLTVPIRHSDFEKLQTKTTSGTGVKPKQELLLYRIVSFKGAQA